MAIGLFSLYQATGEFEWYEAARRLTLEALELFSDPDGGALFTTGSDAEQLIARKKDQMDNPLPSGNSMIAEALAVLSAYEGDRALADAADAVISAGAVLIDRYPSAVRELAIVGPGAHGLADAVWSGFHPDLAVAVSTTDAAPIPLLEDRWSDGATLAYLCRNFVCDRPVTGGHRGVKNL